MGHNHDHGHDHTHGANKKSIITVIYNYNELYGY